jgi:AraC-like DNA-binding protein
MRDIGAHPALSHQVTQFVTEHAAHFRFPTLEETAANFHMSASALSKRLQEEGKCFRVLRRQVKVAMARQFLAQSGLPIKCFIERAGYTNYGALCRAFQSEYRQSPREFRRELKQLKAERNVGSSRVLAG